MVFRSPHIGAESEVPAVSRMGRFPAFLQLCCKSTMCNICTMYRFPNSQAELIKTARGSRSQVEFSKLLGCDRSCLSRYESEALGAPPHVISKCLQLVAASVNAMDQSVRPFDTALAHVRNAVAELELLQAAVQTQVRR